MEKCKYCTKEFETKLKLGGHLAWCKENPLYKEKSRVTKEKISAVHKGKKLSNEQKEKISEGRKKYLMENPHMVPYKLNHSSKISYPERYFLRVLRGFIFQYKVPGTLYEIDFANPGRKIAIEIDGDQHYLDQTMVDHDIKRDEILKNMGWETIRIRWSNYRSLDRVEREKIIEKIMTFSLDIEKDIIFFCQIKEEKKEKEIRDRKDKKEKTIEGKRRMILESNIDFSKFGWVREVSEILNITPNSGGRWVRENMEDFYKLNCYKRK
jgi:very-short-patch-repair endonuclease